MCSATLAPTPIAVAISNSRLVALSDGNVTFRWRDSAHATEEAHDSGRRKSSCAASCSMYCRLASCAYATSDFSQPQPRHTPATLLPTARRIRGKDSFAAEPSVDQTHSLWNCPVCGGTMHVVERLSAAQLLLALHLNRSVRRMNRCQTSTAFARASARSSFLASSAQNCSAASLFSHFLTTHRPASANTTNSARVASPYADPRLT